MLKYSFHDIITRRLFGLVDPTQVASKEEPAKKGKGLKSCPHCGIMVHNRCATCPGCGGRAVRKGLIGPLNAPREVFSMQSNTSTHARAKRAAIRAAHGNEQGLAAPKRRAEAALAGAPKKMKLDEPAAA